MTNQNWRLQAKPIRAIDPDTNIELATFTSVWQASVFISSTHTCHRDTARREIRRSIHNHVPRYGCLWEFVDDNPNKV